jgi:hypothetical protein
MKLKKKIVIAFKPEFRDKTNCDIPGRYTYEGILLFIPN